MLQAEIFGLLFIVGTGQSVPVHKCTTTLLYHFRPKRTMYEVYRENNWMCCLRKRCKFCGNCVHVIIVIKCEQKNVSQSYDTIKWQWNWSNSLFTAHFVLNLFICILHVTIQNSKSRLFTQNSQCLLSDIANSGKSRKHKTL